jgi:peptide chain release factor 2
MRERTDLEERLGSLNRFESELLDAITLVELAEAEHDEASEKEGLDQLKALKAEAGRRQMEALLSGEANANDTYIEIHAGAGGTESCDWARMLFRMYARWAERHKFKVEIIEETAGDEAGLKSGTLFIKGHNAHGWAKTESGVHRLVRISPFDSNARRHTSFASVWIYPVIDDRMDVDVKESDCRIDTYRSSGLAASTSATDSAVRITHIPQGSSSLARAALAAQEPGNAWSNVAEAPTGEQRMKRPPVRKSDKTDIGWNPSDRSYAAAPTSS